MEILYHHIVQENGTNELTFTLSLKRVWKQSLGARWSCLIYTWNDWVNLQSDEDKIATAMLSRSGGLPFWSTTPPAGIPCYCTVASDLWRSEVNGWMEGMRHDILCYIFRLLPLIYPSHYSISLSCLRTRTINTHVQAWPASNGTHNGSFPRASRVATVVWWKMTSPPTPPCLSLSLSPATLLCVSLSLSLS